MIIEVITFGAWQASCFGCGCWAQRSKAGEKGYTVGISTTGCGEHLVRTFLARECALELSKSSVGIKLFHALTIWTL